MEAEILHWFKSCKYDIVVCTKNKSEKCEAWTTIDGEHYLSYGKNMEEALSSLRTLLAR